MPEQQNVPPGMPSGEAPPGAPKQAGGLFAPKPKTGLDLSKSVSDVAGELNNVSRRLMVIEERYTNLRKKTEVTDQNMLNSNKKMMTEVQTTNSEVEEMKKQINDMIDKLKIMVRELKECAKREEVEVLQKYINIWQPINFVTRDGLNKTVRDQVEAQFKDLNIKLKQEDYIKEQIRLTLRDLKLERD